MLDRTVLFLTETVRKRNIVKMKWNGDSKKFHVDVLGKVSLIILFLF